MVVVVVVVVVVVQCSGRSGGGGGGGTMLWSLVVVVVVVVQCCGRGGAPGHACCTVRDFENLTPHLQNTTTTPHCHPHASESAWQILTI